MLTYYSDEVESFSDIHLKKLLKAGFVRENITGKVVTVDPPKGCIYWKAKTILAPKVLK